MNKNTHNNFNELRFPISFGMFPDILLRDKSLNNCKIIKMVNMIFFPNINDVLHLFDL